MTDHPQLQELAGYDLGTHVVEYDDRTVILYALAVGAPANQLELVFERDLRAIPTLACALGLWAVEGAGALGAYDPRRSLHARQLLTMHGTLPTSGPLEMQGRVTNVFDKGTLNPLNDILPLDGVIREAFMSDSNDWYLFADPQQVPAFAIGFVGGKREPFVGIKDPTVRDAMGAGMDPYTFDFDSIEFKVRHDFGVAPVDPRGAFRAVVP